MSLMMFQKLAKLKISTVTKLSELAVSFSLLSNNDTKRSVATCLVPDKSKSKLYNG